jgi:hypothetical protein
VLHVDMFALNKSGIAYQDRSRRSETAVNHKRNPHQQLRYLGAVSCFLALALSGSFWRVFTCTSSFAACSEYAAQASVLSKVRSSCYLDMQVLHVVGLFAGTQLCEGRQRLPELAKEPFKQTG